MIPKPLPKPKGQNLGDLVREAVQEHLGGIYLARIHDPLVQAIVHKLGPRIRAATEKGIERTQCGTKEQTISLVTNRINELCAELARIKQPGTDEEIRDFTTAISMGIGIGWAMHIKSVDHFIPSGSYLPICQEMLAETFDKLEKRK